jgi:Transposase IS4
MPARGRACAASNSASSSSSDESKFQEQEFDHHEDDDDDDDGMIGSVLLAGLSLGPLYNDESSDISEFKLGPEESDSDSDTGNRAEIAEAIEEMQWKEADLGFRNMDPIIQNKFLQHLIPPKEQLHSGIAPFDVFQHFLPDYWFELIAAFSNQYSMCFFAMKFQAENAAEPIQHSQLLVGLTTAACAASMIASQDAQSLFKRLRADQRKSSTDQSDIELQDRAHEQAELSREDCDSAIQRATVEAISSRTASEKRLHRFKPISGADIKSFIACLIFMGQFHSPQLRDYWDHRSQQHFVTETMNRDRFFEISRFFHLCDERSEQFVQSERLRSAHSRHFSKTILSISRSFH